MMMTKHQNPNTKQQRNSKSQISTVKNPWVLRVFGVGVLVVFGFWCLVFSANADSVLNSKHDLSVTGPGPIKASTESEVCIFCHTPHRGTGENPLWNHSMSSATYTVYDSS